MICVFISGCDKEDLFEFYEDGWSVERVNAIDWSTYNLPYYYLRIPFCGMTNDGTLIVGSDIREGTSDDMTQISIGIVRFNRNNNSFSDGKIIIPHTLDSYADRSMDGTILVDRNTGRIFVFAHRITTGYKWEETYISGEYGFSCTYVYSDDDGITWSPPKNLKDVLSTSISNIVTLFGGVGHGITMEDGTLVLPIQCKMATNDTPSSFNIQSGIIYSKDHGTTWNTSKSLVPCYSSENMVVEYESGQLMINCRGYVGLRRVYVTSDLGDSWEPHVSDLKLIEPRACQGSFHKVSGRGFFLNPMNPIERANITLQVSDDFIMWKPVLQIQKWSGFGYTCLCNWGNQLFAVTETNGSNIMLYRIKYQ